MFISENFWTNDNVLTPSGRMRIFRSKQMKSSSTRKPLECGRFIVCFVRRFSKLKRNVLVTCIACINIQSCSTFVEYSTQRKRTNCIFCKKAFQTKKNCVCHIWKLHKHTILFPKSWIWEERRKIRRKNLICRSWKNWLWWPKDSICLKWSADFSYYGTMFEIGSDALQNQQ